MPPCAAIECARRGESWKQKQETWYPSSASDAAAEAPASPEPTTRTWYLGLLAGATSRISDRWRVHLVSSAPLGTLARRSTVIAVHRPARPREWRCSPPRSPPPRQRRAPGVPGRSADGASRASATRSTCRGRSEEHTSELQSRPHLVCRLLL